MAYNIDLSHSHVQFSVRHMMISKVRGEFKSGAARLTWTRPTLPIPPSRSRSTRPASTPRTLSGTATCARPIFSTSRSSHPAFKSTKVEVKGDDKAKLYGDLTIRDVTKPVVLDVEFSGQAKSPWGTTNYGFEASTKINREDWGLPGTWPWRPAAGWSARTCRSTSRWNWCRWQSRRRLRRKWSAYVLVRSAFIDTKTRRQRRAQRISSLCPSFLRVFVSIGNPVTTAYPCGCPTCHFQALSTIARMSG